MLAPARISFGAVVRFTPPSTSMMASQPASSSMARTSATLRTQASISFCPPKPGFTVMTSARSKSPSRYLRHSGDVAGFSATPARQPAPRISWSTRCRCRAASACTVMIRHPASAKAWMYFSGLTIIRWASTGRPYPAARFAMSGPKLRLGT